MTGNRYSIAASSVVRTIPNRDRYQTRRQMQADIEADRGDGVDEG